MITLPGLFALVLVLGGCSIAGSPQYPARRTPSDDSAHRSGGRIDSWETERLRRVIMPLVQAMDRPCQSNQVRIGVVRENEINAANTGNCEFYLTTGLLASASDDRLRGVMAHEIAHQDLGHVAKAQALGAGLNIGAVLLEQLMPGSGAIAPLAGTLIARGYGRTEEYAADRHAVGILRRAGYPSEIMAGTLAWLRRMSGENGGGFLSTHPALDDRIAALKRAR